MKDLARYGAILVLVVFVVMRVVEVREDSTPKATQAVAGVVKQLSETEVGFLFQLDKQSFYLNFHKCKHLVV